MAACFSILNCLCCCYLVAFNIFGMFMGFIVLLLGVALLWGIQIAKLAAGPMLANMTSSLNSLAGNSTDIYSMLDQLSVVTGSMGSAFLILGIIIIVVSVFGCCGGCCGIKCCLLVYIVAVGAIFLAQLIAVIIWFANAEMIKNAAKTAMTDSLKEYTGISSKNIQTLVQNLVQMFIGCCGVNNGSDFASLSPKWNKTYTIDAYSFNLSYPISCCKFNTGNFSIVDKYCPYNTTSPSTSNYQKGCYSEFFNFIEKQFKLDYIFYALAGILLVQLLLALGAVIRIMYKRQENKVKPH